MIYVKPAKSAGISSAADSALATLLGQHTGVGSVLDAVVALGVVVGVPLRVARGTRFTRAPVRGGILVPRGGDGSDAARFAPSLLTVVDRLVSAKRIERLDRLASGAELGPLGRLPTRMRDVPRLGISDLALPAVARQAIMPLDRLVKAVGGFSLIALRTEFHRFLLLSKRIMTTMFVNVNGARYAT